MGELVLRRAWLALQRADALQSMNLSLAIARKNLRCSRANPRQIK
jgi:hypothetical protein